jgi:hypothetical protein
MTSFDRTDRRGRSATGSGCIRRTLPAESATPSCASTTRGARWRSARTSRADQGSWAFVLKPVGRDRTRLIVRTRTQPTEAWTFAGAFGHWIFSPAHFVMERRMMIGLKDVAERGTRAREANHADVALWTVTLVASIGLVGLVFTQRQWRRPLVGAASLALLFMFLTLRQPPLGVGIVLVAAGLALSWRHAHPRPATLPA